MSSTRIELTVEPRQTGKHWSRKSRSGRKVPAVVYGSVKNKSILLDEGVVVKYNKRAYENALFNLKSADPELNNVVALIKDIQIHPVSRRPQHIDFFALDLKKAVRVSVEIRCEGKPLGLADGGILNVVNRQVEIECLPTEIPEGITVDVSNLGIGDSIHASDLNVPEGVKLMSNPELTIAVVNLLEEESLTPTSAPDAAAAGAASGAPAAGAAAPAAGDKAAAPAAGAAKDAKAPAAGAKK